MICCMNRYCRSKELIILTRGVVLNSTNCEFREVVEYLKQPGKFACLGGKLLKMVVVLRLYFLVCLQ
ncbi:hypothetical protein MKX03_034597 [Papaver bracteatum]|nr:hypothetical protein MKX03_034597 [Papaver bracteatum]